MFDKVHTPDGSTCIREAAAAFSAANTTTKAELLERAKAANAEASAERRKAEYAEKEIKIPPATVTWSTRHGLASSAPNRCAWMVARVVSSAPDIPSGKPR